MTIDAVLALLHRGKSLAACCAAAQENRLGWVGVYPLNLSRRETAVVLQRSGIASLHGDAPIFRIRKFEVDRQLILDDVSIGEEDLANAADILAIGDDDLQSKLQALGTAIEALDLPFKSDYPI